MSPDSGDPQHSLRVSDGFLSVFFPFQLLVKMNRLETFKTVGNEEGKLPAAYMSSLC